MYVLLGAILKLRMGLSYEGGGVYNLSRGRG